MSLLNGMIFIVFFFVIFAVTSEVTEEAFIGVGVDLHTHSSFSDGTDLPIDLVRKAKAAGIKVLGLTDHDQIRYSKEAFDEAERLHIVIVPGSEISVEWSFSQPTSKGTFAKAHLLAYFTRDDPKTELFQMLANLRNQRDNRNGIILGKLASNWDFKITMEEVEAEARDKDGKLQVVGRPHIASVMVKKGYVKDIGDAFAKYLNDGALKLEKWSLDLEETIRAVDRHFGVAVLAHPSTVNLTDDEFEQELKYLLEVKKAPLRGLECYSSRHSNLQAEFYYNLAKKYSLLPTGGSDYHGKRKKNVELNQFGGGTDDWNERSVEAFYDLLDLFGSFSPWVTSGGSSRSSQAGRFTIITHLVVYVFLGYLFTRVAPLYNMPIQPGWKGAVQKRMKGIGPLNEFMAWFVGIKSSDPVENTDAPSPTTKEVDLESQTPTKGREDRQERNERDGHRVSSGDNNKQPGPDAPKNKDNVNLALCTFGLCFIYIGWSWLQERMMTQEYGAGKKMKNSEFVVLANRLAACIFAYIAVKVSGPHQNNAPPVNFAMPSVSNMLSTWCQYEALQYVSFPLQVLAKTSKMLASMVMGIFVNGKTYPPSDYFMALVAMVGLALFHLTEEKADSTRTSSAIGLFLLVVYIMADAFTPQYQQAVFKKFSISKYQMMWGMNFFSAIFSFLFLLFEGKLWDCYIFATENPSFLSHLLIMSIFTVAGQVCIYYTISRHGAVAFSAIMTFRQLVTIVLSIVSFGHHVTPVGIFGLGIVFLVGGFWTIYRK